MTMFRALVLLTLVCLSAGWLAADPIPDPRIVLSGGVGSQGVGLDPFGFNLNDQGGGIFFFCNDTAETCPGDGDPTHPGIVVDSVGAAAEGGTTFFNMTFKTSFPEEGGLFNCESDAYAFCTFDVNDGTITINFFGIGEQSGDGTGSEVFPPTFSDLAFAPLAEGPFPGLPPGTHFTLNFNNDPDCVPGPDAPCEAGWVPGAFVSGQANSVVPEPGTWALLLTGMGAAFTVRRRLAKRR
jgi:hypothetical protein